MSGEPKTLTLTLEEAMRAVHFERLPELRERHGYLADVQMEMTQSGWWVFLNNDGEENQIKEFDRWEDAASFALGVPVVARDEAAELRAAVREYLEAGDTARAAVSMRSVTDDEFDDLLKRKDAAFAALRRLAGGESEEEQP